MQCTSLFLTSLWVPLAAQATERVSLDAIGRQANGGSNVASLSADGRYVVFQSVASDLVPGDTNGVDDIFLRDRVAGTTERVSVATSGAQGSRESLTPVLSADGRCVAFESWADDLVDGDGNGDQDIFLRDRSAATTERVSLGSSGAEINGGSWDPALSADGRFVAFTSNASNLVDGDSGAHWDVFVRDRQLATTERISVDSSGAEADGDSTWTSLSADGRFVAFASLATNLVDGDTNGAWDVFVHDRALGTTRRVSVSSTGSEGDGDSHSPSLSADGSVVAFESLAANLIPADTHGRDVFVHELLSGTTTRSSQTAGGVAGDGASSYPCLSADGLHVAFASDATNLVPVDANGEGDIFVHDRAIGALERMSVGAHEEGDSLSSLPALSADGRVVAFESLATNLVARDTNGTYDIFVRERCQPATAAQFLGDGLNADVVTAVEARLGSTWSAPLVLGHPHGSGGLLVLRVRTRTVNGSDFVSPIGGRWTETLISGSLLAVLTGTHDGVSGNVPPRTIPPSFTLVGSTWAAQYTVLGGGFADLSSAVTGVVGCP